MNENFFSFLEIGEGLLSHQTADLLTKMIISGKLKPGDRLPSERELGEQLGVSRTVIREASKLLRASGLIRVQSGVGTFVTKPTRNILRESISNSPESYVKKISDLLVARKIIEPAITEFAAKNRNDSEIAKLEEAMMNMELSNIDVESYIKWNTIFHNTLAQASNNIVLSLFMHSVVDLLQEASLMWLNADGSKEQSNYCHRLIFEAVKEQDQKAARESMRKHIFFIEKELAESIIFPLS